MANKFRGIAEINFSSEDEAGNDIKQTRKLQLDANAFCEIEEATGLNLGGMLAGLSDPSKLSMRTVRGIIYGALQRFHPSPSMEEGLREAGNVISDAGLEVVMAALQSAATGAMGKAKKPTRATAKQS